MKLPIFVLIFAASTSFAAVGCSAGSDDASGAAPDEQAPGTAESDLTSTKFTALDRVTLDQVADEVVALFNKQMDEVTAAHPDITTITKANRSRLTQIGSTFYIDLGDAIDSMLEDKGWSSAKPSSLRSFARSWALKKLAPHVGADGIVTFTGVDPLIVYQATQAAEERLSIVRATQPRGANIKTLRAQWSKVEAVRGNLDSAFLRPVKVDREPSITEMKKHFHIPSSASMTSWGFNAVDDMAKADEGPENAPEFKPIADTLKHGIGIKKRFFFSANNSQWSTNVLVVMDEKNQLWGFSMGYSE